MLERWGLRVGGSTLKDPTKRATGGGFGIDDDRSVIKYVEETPGFEMCRPILVHVYVAGQSLDTYRFRQPGESRLKSAMRHGQAHLLLQGWTDDQITQGLYYRFLANLEKRLMRHPFILPSERISVEIDG